MKTITLEAPAKINLTLDILSRRADGYHDLRMVMQSVSLGDTVTVTETGDGFALLAEGIALPAGKVTLEQRAAESFFRYLGRPMPGLEVRLRKRVPAYAGLGGGSADVAAVLRCLRALYAPELPRSALEEIGLAVGSDVPFCVHGGTCRCTGIGEVVEPVAPMPHCYLAICKPPAGMSTPRAYALLDDYPQTRNFGTPRMLSALEKGDLGRVAATLSNRFDETMRLTQVRQIKRMMLAAGALGAMMTGSGSAVYGLFDTKEKAENCLGVLEGRGKLYLCSPCAGGAEPLE